MILLFLGLFGCGTCPPDGFECPEPTPLARGTFGITESDRPDLASGEVTIGEDGTFVVDYVDDQGRTVRVRYARVD